ncbi:family 20 glycosylhydrolase [Acetobacter sp. LMG 32666]|uniref:beta-N-acetylhexosaminidase n=1 Tax=Acetobacter sp. LMG 32666 TaxID=2959295 RepID=UPI0030C7F822
MTTAFFKHISTRTLLLCGLALLGATPCTTAWAQEGAETHTTDLPPAFVRNMVRPPLVMPAPAVLQTSGAAFALPQSLSVRWDSPPTPLLLRALERLRIRLGILAGRPINFTQPPPQQGAFVLNIRTAKDPAFPGPAMREGYTLDVAPTGITLTTQGPAGVLHGLTSLSQLVRQERDGPVLAQAHIEDTPRFAWRGLMLDTSRHFMPLPDLLRQLDAMEMLKLNVLHIHLSDGAAFRVESKAFPRLHTIGSHGQYYTQEQIRQLVREATDRGIRVVPEFDTPGHSYAMLLAYPRYAANAPLNTTDRAEINRAALDPTNPATLGFVNAVYAEMAALFPDPVFHIGGDEVVARQWAQSPHIAAYMKQHHVASVAALQADYTRHVAHALRLRGKTVMGWDEVQEADIPPDTIIESWRGPAHTAQATAAGHDTVISGPYYLDRLLPALAYYTTDPLDMRKDAAEARAAAQTTGPTPPDAPPPPASTDKPEDAPPPPLTDAQKNHVLGAETALWAEVVSPDMLDARVWPRAAALAERFWSAPERCNATTLYPRLAIMADRLDLLGLQARANTQRMLERLAPGETEAASVLLQAVSPVRNYAHNHEFLQIRHKQTATLQQLGTPADIASPDSFDAETFNAEAQAFIAGHTELRHDLETMLTRWANNDSAFAQAAAHNAGLTPALPASAQLARLARAGLAALGEGHTLNWRENARTALADAKKDIAASASIHVVTNTPQPAGDLIQRIVPGVEVLLDQAIP